MVTSLNKAVLLGGLFLCGSVGLFIVAGDKVGAGVDLSALVPPPLVDLPPQFITPMTLGHRNLYEDVLTIWAVQLLNDETKTLAQGSELSGIMMRIARHRPRLDTFYTFSCYVLAQQMLRPDDCLALTKEGMQAKPQSWRIPLTQAYVFQKMLKQPEKAAAFYALAARSPRVPPYIADAALALSVTGSLTADMATAEELLRQAAAGTALGDKLDTSISH